MAKIVSLVKTLCRLVATTSIASQKIKPFSLSLSITNCRRHVNKQSSFQRPGLFAFSLGVTRAVFASTVYERSAVHFTVARRRSITIGVRDLYGMPHIQLSTPAVDRQRCKDIARHGGLPARSCVQSLVDKIFGKNASTISTLGARHLPSVLPLQLAPCQHSNGRSRYKKSSV